MADAAWKQADRIQQRWRTIILHKAQDPVRQVHAIGRSGRGFPSDRTHAGLFVADFAVLGRFVATQPALSPLRTSANQSLRLFTQRYTEGDFDTTHEVEVTIEPAGLVQITGFPTAGLPA